jgi:hypothetical protein
MSSDYFAFKGFLSPEIIGRLEGLNMASERLTRQQKKELGILPVQILANAKHADLNKDMTAKELAFAYAAYVSDVDEYRLGWVGVQQGTYGVDWNELLAFLEKVMELLLKFLPLFI